MCNGKLALHIEYFPRSELILGLQEFLKFFTIKCTAEQVAKRKNMLKDQRLHAYQPPGSMVIHTESVNKRMGRAIRKSVCEEMNVFENFLAKLETHEEGDFIDAKKFNLIGKPG